MLLTALGRKILKKKTVKKEGSYTCDMIMPTFIDFFTINTAVVTPFTMLNDVSSISATET
jgi:hypothetical protein